jgi:hypothetical protein
MNAINRTSPSNSKPRLIILENDAKAGLHASGVEKNARLVNPSVEITKINARSEYYEPSEDKGLKHYIQSDLIGYLKGMYESLKAIADDASMKNTVVNISMGVSQFHMLHENLRSFPGDYVNMATPEEQKQLGVSSTEKKDNRSYFNPKDGTVNPTLLSKFETFIDDAWKGMQDQIQSWQSKIKDVVAKLKTKNIAVVKSAGNNNEKINSSEYSSIKSQFEKDEAIDPMMKPDIGIIGVSLTNLNGDLASLATRGNHFKFATIAPDRSPDSGTSYASPAIGTLLAEKLAEGYTVDEAVAELQKKGILKKDDQGNPYTYVPLPKRKK